jgi:hypothetical protein
MNRQRKGSVERNRENNYCAFDKERKKVGKMGMEKKKKLCETKNNFVGKKTRVWKRTGKKGIEK